MNGIRTASHRGAWNKGKRLRDFALFDLGIDSKLRACDLDLVKLRVRDVCHGDRLAARAGASANDPVQFEITPPTREALEAWIKSAGLHRAEVRLLTLGRVTRCEGGATYGESAGRDGERV